MKPCDEDVMSEVYQSLTHSRWNRKYPVVFVANRRHKVPGGFSVRFLKAKSTIAMARLAG
jgi:hypothetical protein